MSVVKLYRVSFKVIFCYICKKYKYKFKLVGNKSLIDYIGLNILRNSQLVSGEPMYPSGHVQTGS